MNNPTARALSLFDDYVDLPLAERELKLRELAACDPALHLSLLALLQADDGASVLDRSPAEISTGKHGHDDPSQSEHREHRDSRVGSRVGAWRIDRAIGYGGIGTVYLAHRDDGEYRQQVALKCIRTELTSAQLTAAFRDERNLLARLDHPGIAALVDGGVGEDGQPWFALRFVDGVALDQWCDARRASVGERIELLLQVCDALSYAHAQGIVHRDIKPSNLLVSENGRVQLIDFAISPHLAAADAGPITPIAITPHHSAPEARGAHAFGAHGPATDLYALGVLMYRLLCAQWPIPQPSPHPRTAAARSSEPLPMDHLLDPAMADESSPGRDASETDPKVVAQQRGARDPAALRRELSGDLSAIALKAVATRPQDRYASVNEFAEDLRRWREHRPVVARADHRIGRARKWLRRNRLTAGLAAAASLALVLGLGLSWLEQRRTVREMQATTAVSHLFTSTLGTATLSGLGRVPFSSKALLEKTERELRALPLADQPALFGHGLATLARSHAVIGDFIDADRLAAQAQRIGGAHDGDGFIAATRVSILNARAGYAEAAKLASTQLEQLGDENDEDTRLARITLLNELAVAQWGLADPPTALQTLERAFDQARALGSGHRQILAQLLIQRSHFRLRLMRFDQAEADARTAMALVQSSNPVLADDARQRLVEILGWKSNSGAGAMADQLLQSRRRTLGEHHPKTGRAWVLVAYARGDASSKLALLHGRALIAAAYGREHPEYADALATAPRIVARDGREVANLLLAALRIRERTLGPLHESSINSRRNYAYALLSMDSALRRPQDIEQGLAMMRRALLERRNAGIPAPLEKLYLGRYLTLFGSDHDLGEAESLLREARDDMPRYFKANDAFPMETEVSWYRLRYRQGHRDEADGDFANWLQVNAELIRSSGTVRDYNQRVRSAGIHESLIYRAIHAYETCRRAQAEAHLRQAIDFDTRAFGADSPNVRDAKRILVGLGERGGIPVAATAAVIGAHEAQAMSQRARACAAPARR